MTANVISDDPTTGEVGEVPKSELQHVEDQVPKHSIDENLKGLDDATEDNFVYDDADEEPEIHLRTWIAVLAMFLLTFVQMIALLAPPVVLEYMGESLHDTARQTWITNAVVLVQAVFSPIFCSVSDMFQARKSILVGASTVAFIGAAIAPGSKSVGRMIAAQALIGVGFITTSLSYAIPSEILPRKWRPLVQSASNVFASLGACVGPLIIGAMTRSDPIDGWKNYWWMEMGLWGLAAVGIFVGYRPPKRHTRYDHLSLTQKIATLDFTGCFLFAAGLTLLLVGLNLGGGLFAWSDSRTLGTLVVGIVTLIAFGIYEWKGTKTGLVHHNLFRGQAQAGRNVGIFLALIFIEGVILFAFVVFYPLSTRTLFDNDPFLVGAREQPFWIAGGISTVVFGVWAVHAKSIRVPMCAGFLVCTAGMAAFATIEPGDTTRACIFAGLAGAGVGAPFILVVAGLQLATPHAFIATATALAITCRAVAAAVFTAIYAAALKERLKPRAVKYVAKAALSAGLPPGSVQAFVAAIAASDIASVGKVPGVTPAIIAAGVAAMKQAFADSVRVVFIIAAPFGVLACALCFFLGDQSDQLTYRVDAPIEDLHARHHQHQSEANPV